MSELKGKVFHVDYTEKAAVYNCYMGFCKDGGIFVPSNYSGHLGESVFLMAKLPESGTAFLLSGKVAWLNYGRRKGIGVRLIPDEHSRKFKATIENLLATSMKSANATYTM